MSTLSDIKIKMERRPCWVIINGEETKAMFHTWYNGKALIELEDGSVHFYGMEYGSLVFLDTNFKDYIWGDEECCMNCKYEGTYLKNMPCSDCKHNSWAISNGYSRFELKDTRK